MTVLLELHSGNIFISLIFCCPVYSFSFFIYSTLDLLLATRPDSSGHFDPASVRFTDEELRPQPIIRYAS